MYVPLYRYTTLKSVVGVPTSRKGGRPHGKGVDTGVPSRVRTSQINELDVNAYMY